MPAVASSPARWLAPATAAYVALAVAAGIDGGRLLLDIDGPVTRWVVEHRTAWLDDVMLALTNLGSGAVVLGLGVFLAVVVAPQHRTLAFAVALVPIVRPFLVTGLKELVDRDRPPYERLSDAAGSSFPSGHVVAASMWLLVPIVLSVVRPGSRAVRATTIAALVVVVVVAATRVYLGVHWTTDVIAGALIGALLIAAVWFVRERPVEPPAEI